MSDPVRAESPTVRRWVELESMFSPRGYTGADVADSFRYFPGHTVLVTAPHAVLHHREGRGKEAELFIGSLAVALAAETGCGALVVTGEQLADPARAAGHPFKERALEVASGYSLVLDLHGMSDRHGVDLCLGTSRAALAGVRAHAAGVLMELASAEGMTLSVDSPFAASPAGTVTASLTRSGVPALQLEVARHLRSPRTDPVTAMRLFDLLRAFVTALL